MARRIMVIRLVCLLIFLGAAVLSTGCSSRATGTIKGKVTYKGTVLKTGNINFVGTEGQGSSAAQIGEDGTYTIATLNAGSYKVVIETESYNPGRLTAQNKFAPKQNDAPVKPLDPSIKPPEGYHPSSPADAQALRAGSRYTEIPAKYGKAETTDLTFTVTGGSQTFDIELK